MKSARPRLRLCGTSLHLKYDHINWGFKVPVLLYISVNKNPSVAGEGTRCCLIVLDHHKRRQTDK